MAVTVENGTGVANADSYISVADATAYFGTRLYSTAWSEASAEDKEVALIQAARTLDNYVSWFGLKSDPDQTMQWPRIGIYELQNVNGVETDVELIDTVPTVVIQAQCELAIYLLGGDKTSLPSTAGFKKLNVAGAISFEVDNNTKPMLIPAIVLQLVGKYGNRKGSQLQVIRA